MSSVARAALLALNVLLLSVPARLEPALGTTGAFAATTVLLTLINIALVVAWDRLSAASGQAAKARSGRFSLVFAVALILLVEAARRWVHEILIAPIDPQRADMLVVIQAGIHRLLQGRDPYAMYNVPWPATLPYGPVMWAPLMLPTVIHVDIRVVTLIGFLFTPCVCAIAAADEWARGRGAAALGWLGLLGAIVFSPDLRQFVSIAHTPAYWPLLALLAWLVARERWDAAAIVSGLLIVARTTMVSLAPIVLIAVWYRARPRFGRTMVLLAAAFALPFLPFAIADWSALRYALYGSYQEVIKGFVWTSTTWVQHTIGLTGPLLAHRWGPAAEVIQGIVMIGVYAACAAAVRSGRRPLPWLAFALLAFSMTSLWPVTYLYFDVCVLAIAAAAAEIAWTRSAAVLRTWIMPLALAALLVMTTFWSALPADPSIDVGTLAGRESLYAGFSSDEREGDVTFAWINGTRGEILVPRRSRGDAVIDIVCEPHLPTRDTVQQLSASLNGIVIGTVTVTGGWQHVRLAAPARAWQIGVNELTLFLSSAVSPQQLGISDDGRKLSLAVDRLTVKTR